MLRSPPYGGISCDYKKLIGARELRGILAEVANKDEIPPEALDLIHQHLLDQELIQQTWIELRAWGPSGATNPMFVYGEGFPRG